MDNLRSLAVMLIQLKTKPDSEERVRFERLLSTSVMIAIALGANERKNQNPDIRPIDLPTDYELARAFLYAAAGGANPEYVDAYRRFKFLANYEAS